MKKLFFLTQSGRITSAEETAFRSEKGLQHLTEKNLEELLGAKFLKSEYKLHDGKRIDTLGLTDGRYPTIIEYKKVQSHSVVGQILSYANSLSDYKEAFELLIVRQFGQEEAEKIDWKSIRLVCIAKEFSTHDLGYLRSSAREVELVTYSFFNNDTLLFEWDASGKPPPQGAPRLPDKRASSRQIRDSTKTSSKTPRIRGKADQSLASVIERSDGNLSSLYHQAVQAIEEMGADVVQHPTKLVLIFKRGKATFVSLRPVPNLGKLRAWVNLDPKREKLDAGFTRDVTGVGKWGSGNLEIVIGTEKELKKAVAYFRKSYRASL